MTGRVCGWCGKPGGICASLLRKWLDEAGVKTRNDSRYFHGNCAAKASAALQKATPAPNGTAR